eukprot:jgi/Tetstr1/436827/TSEL_025605.t1
MLAELRRLWCLLDSHGIHLRARYVRSAANVWADRLSRHLDSDDWQLDLLMFSEQESRFGPHSIDRFASALKTLLPRYNAAWLDPTCKAVDSWHLPDADWRRENNWVRKGLAASQLTLHSELMRAPLPARVVLKAATLAKALRLELGLTWGTDPGTVVRVELFRANLAFVGATTVAYVIGVTMQKIKYFGCWAMESSVVLDYIDPTVLPCPAAWHLFGWMTPWGGQ